MDDNLDSIAELIYIVKGDRTLREYGADTGVSYSNIQRILNRKYKPSPDTIKKLTLGDKHPRGDVSYEDMMVAAGYMSNESRNRQEEHFRLLERQDEEERTAFQTRTELIIFGGLVKAGIRFQKLESKKTYHVFSPDLTVSFEGQSISTWMFRFVPRGPKSEERDGKIIVKELPTTYVRRMLAETVLIAPDAKRKVSVVTDFADYYGEIASFKGKISYKGDLSVILIDAKSMNIEREEYLSYYKESTEGLLLRKPETDFTGGQFDE